MDDCKCSSARLRSTNPKGKRTRHGVKCDRDERQLCCHWSLDGRFCSGIDEEHSSGRLGHSRNTVLGNLWFWRSGCRVLSMRARLPINRINVPARSLRNRGHFFRFDLACSALLLVGTQKRPFLEVLAQLFHSYGITESRRLRRVLMGGGHDVPVHRPRPTIVSRNTFPMDRNNGLSPTIVSEIPISDGVISET